MKDSPFKAEIYLAINVLLTLGLVFNSKLSEVYAIIILIYGMFRIFNKKNADGSAHIMAGYVVGIEVLFRMNSGGFGYEFGKYAVMLFLVIGILVSEKKKKIPFLFVAFILAMLPSVIFADYPTFEFERQMISFNLAGPVCLGISVIYFHKRRLSLIQMRKLLLAILYPITGMAFFLYFRSGTLENVEFTTESNFQASGGFGPNQVSTILGLGILIIAIAYFLGIRLFRMKYLNIILLMLFLVRGLATFSRGGMIAPLAAIVVCIIIMSITNPQFQARMNKVFYAFMIICVVGFLGFNYVNDVSGGLLEMRFKGESMYNKQKSNLLSGRDNIFMNDLEIFQDNVLTGVGPGNAGEVREQTAGITAAAAHIEYSRLLAEHGLFGIFAIFVMLLFPVKTFFQLRSVDDKVLLIMCTVFVFISLGHSAMRTASPGFIYGLAYINLVRQRT